MKNKLIFDEASHIYSLDGKAIPSVTQIVAPKVNEAFVAAAAEYGTELHSLVAAWISGKKQFAAITPSPAEMDKDFSAIMKWVKSEQTQRGDAESERLGFYAQEGMTFAGTADIIITLPSKDLEIVDIKTSEPHKWHKAQLGGYALILGSLGHITALKNLYVKKGKVFEVFHSPKEAIEEFKLAYNRFIAGEEIASGAEVLPIEDGLLNQTQKAFDYFLQLKKQTEEAEEKLGGFKAALMEQMTKYNLKSFDYKGMNFCFVDAHQRESLDTKALKTDWPEICAQYQKTAQIAESLRIKMKEE